MRPIVIALCVLLAGCVATQNVRKQPIVLDCKGKVAITGSGSLSLGAGVGGSGTDAFTLIGDCGDGFHFAQKPPVPCARAPPVRHYRRGARS